MSVWCAHEEQALTKEREGDTYKEKQNCTVISVKYWYNRICNYKT